MLTNMNEKMFEILTVFYVFTNVCKLTYGHNCILQVKPNELRANCKTQNLSNVPSDLNPKIGYLDLSKNKLLNLTDSSFLHLSNLISLEIREAEIGNQVTADLFSPLQKLEYLDISNSVFLDKTLEFKWPSNLCVLKLVGIGQTHLDLSNLGKLQELDASYNKLSAFPQLPANSSLQYLSLNWNMEVEVTAETLASFRKLISFSFLQPITHRICSSELNCQYVRLKRWMNDWLLKGDLSSCPNVTSEIECDLKFDAELLKGRIKRQPSTPKNNVTEPTAPPKPTVEQNFIIYLLKFLSNYILKQIFVYIFIFIVLPFMLLIVCLFIVCYYIIIARRHGKGKATVESGDTDDDTGNDDKDK